MVSELPGGKGEFGLVTVVGWKWGSMKGLTVTLALSGFLVSLLLARVPAASAASSIGTWSMAGSMHASRQLHTETLLNNGKVLVVGGRDENGTSLASAELFDPGIN